VRRGVAIHQLQYDDLVREPAAALSAICEFIGVDYDPKMTSLEGADRSAIYNGDHHSMVKSACIVADRERPEVLSPQLKNKIERYVVFWRRKYDGAWPVNVHASKNAKAASLLERTRDKALHGLLRTMDLAIPLAYSFVQYPSG